MSAALDVVRVGAVARVGTLAGVDRRTVALEATRDGDDFCVRVTGGVAERGVLSGIGAVVPAPTRVADFERSVRR